MTQQQNKEATKIAIVGMGCMFPQARNLKEFWRLLCQGDDAITDIPETHWAAQDFFDSDPKKPDHTYAKRGGFLPTTSFDPTEWGIPPMAIEATDTAQLLGLVAAKMALEDAGYGDSKEFDRDRVSVILGVTGTLELVIPLGARLGHPIWRQACLDAGIDPKKAEEVVERIGDGYVGWQENSFPGLLGNVVAGRIANRLDFGGTNCVVDAACASSLSAVHLAVMELTSGKADMVLSGGIDTLNDIFMYMCFSKTPALSPTGDARPFSAQADGTMISEGLGMLVLKRLDDAERDGDKIYAVIQGMGSSSDGKSQSIYAPRAAGQVKALQRAYTQAGISPSQVGMVEAHGTGTKVGDATEFTALREHYHKDSDDLQWCALGTVKSQIGHTKAAAGSASLIKAALSLYHKTLPPTIKVDAPNPKMELEESPFYLNTQTRPWISQETRRAGVSALGFGGSNFHAVLEEYNPKKEQTAWDQSADILAFSGESASEITTALNDWQSWLNDSPSNIAIARRASQTRDSFHPSAKCRLTLVWEYNKPLEQSLKQATQVLKTSPNQSMSLPGIYYNTDAAEKLGKVAFLFPGQGSQYIGMGADWVRTFPSSWRALQAADEVLQASLSHSIFPAPSFSEDKQEKHKKVLSNTAVAQPALGAISAGMFDLLGRFGLRPDAVAGHSYGELVALYAAGAMTQSDLFALSQERGRLMAQGEQDRGTMMAVKAPLEEIDQLIKDNNWSVVLANRNSHTQGVLSGSREAIREAEQVLRAQGYKVILLNVSAAFHSELVRDAQAPFQEYLKTVPFQTIDIPVYANTTAAPYRSDAGTIPEMLAAQLLSPVRFVEQIEAMYEDGVRVFLEVGPKTVLTNLTKSILGNKPYRAMGLDRSVGKRSGLLDLAHFLAEAAALGLPVKLSEWEEAPPEPRKQRMKIPLSGANYRAPFTKRPPSPPYQPTSPTKKTETQSATPNKRTSSKALANGTHKATNGTTNGAVSLLSSSLSPTFDAKAPVFSPSNGIKQTAMAKSKPVSAPRNGTNGVQSVVLESQPAMAWSAPASNSQADLWKEALQLVRQGLHAMQTLQHQTTITHQRFLEGQEQSSHALHEMMLRSQQFVASAMQAPMPVSTLPSPPSRAVSPSLPEPVFVQPPSPTPAAPPVVLAPHPVVPPAPAAPTFAPTPAPAAPTFAPTPVVSLGTQEAKVDLSVFQKPQPTPEPAMVPSMATPSSSPNLTDVMLEVVAELTGYPTEMLDPTMDMEADLGIDSIKRVEILSTVSERVPEAAEVDPEQMGRMRTLQEVISYLSEQSPAQAETKATPLQTEAQDSVADVLLQVVAELTGYPTEMLSLEMDMEADLGIDSIKRVEILSSVTEQFPALNGIDTEELRNLRTLGEIAQASETAVGGGSVHPFDFASLQDTLLAGRPDDIARRLLSIENLPSSRKASLQLPPQGEVWVMGEENELSQAMCDAFHQRGYSCLLIAPGQKPTRPSQPLAGALILSQDVEAKAIWDESEENYLKQAFAFARDTIPHIQETLQLEDQAFFATMSRMDGAFGITQMLHASPIQGGLAGLPKTLQHEVPTLSCKALDVPVRWNDWPSIAHAVAEECTHHGPIEVGLHPEHRCTIQMNDIAPESGELLLGEGDVFVISGGARGVTASVAQTLGKALKPTFVLLGRSPLPPEEPAWLTPLQAQDKIKKALFQHGWDGQTIRNPKELQQIFNRIIKNREIRENLQKLKSTGATVAYHAVDVRDVEALSRLFQSVRQQHGPIRGLMHAAGVLEDRLVVDKTDSQFNKVFDTKVQGLRALLTATQEDELKALILFSSVSGRAGNKGQVDYAMANEVLNKVAQQQASLRPGCRVLSANWGPWDGGMVTPELKRHFESQGIQLISLEAGATALLRELQSNNNSAVEVVLGEAFEGELPEANTPPRQLFKKTISLDTHPVLEAHKLQGKPVVPLALLMDWLGQATTKAYPDQALLGYNNVRVLNGVILNQKSYNVWLEESDVQEHNGQTHLSLTLFGEASRGLAKPHLRATAVLGPKDAIGSAHKWDINESLRPYPIPIEQGYQEILFHGSALHGLTEVVGYSEHWIQALSQTAPPPSDWEAQPGLAQWAHDPLVIDDAFQLAILWCFATQDHVSLPTSFESYRQYKSTFSGPIQISLRVNQVTSHQAKGDFQFCDTQGEVVAEIFGYTCTMDASLMQAFHP